MATAEYIMGIDLGTSTLKVGIFDLYGKVLSLESKEYNLLIPGENLVENDIEKYWDDICLVIKKALKNLGDRKYKIISLGTSSQGETIAPINKDGKILHPAIVWLDNRTIKEAEEISEKFDAKYMFEKTGLVEVNTAWPATRIKWFEKNKPELFNDTYKFILIEDYIIYRLTGKIIGEASVYNSSYYYDIIKFDFIDEMLDYLNITRDKLPEIVKPGTMVGNVSKEASWQTGLSTDTKVVIGSMDQIAGAIGAGNTSKGIATETTGSVFAMVITTGEPVFDFGSKLPCFLHAIPGVYTLLPYSMTGGMVLKWFKDNLCQNEIKNARDSGIDVFDLLNELAKKVKPGSEGLVMLPHLQGAFFPEYNPYARGVFFGIAINHTKGHFIRSIMESIGYMMKNDIKLIGNLGVEINKIISLGGGARSDLWSQIKSDISGVKIVVPDITETAVLGAALLSAYGSGVFDSITEASKNFVSFKKEFKPNPDNKKIYGESFSKYKELYGSLKDLFKNI